MDDLIRYTGNKAGVIWDYLNTRNSSTKEELIKKTKLSKDELYFGIGWLARENKIAFDDKMYTLNPTNLTPIIGNDAGTLWKILDVWDELDTTSLRRLSKLDETQLYAALGWLLCEQKINGRLQNKKNNKYLFWLKK
ncbi:MAG: winged helix-turn-helix domain-containing protein [Thermoplasmatota archaeon]